MEVERATNTVFTFKGEDLEDKLEDMIAVLEYLRTNLRDKNELALYPLNSIRPTIITTFKSVDYFIDNKRYIEFKVQKESSIYILIDDIRTVKVYTEENRSTCRIEMGGLRYAK